MLLASFLVAQLGSLVPSSKIHSMWEYLPAGLGLVVTLAGYAGFAYLIYYLLSLPLRRRKQARLLLDLLESGLRQGSSPEQTVVEVAGRRDPALGSSFYLLAARLKQGLRFSEALKKTRKIVPPQAMAMLEIGTTTGDLRRILPECRRLLEDGGSRVLSAINYLVVLFLVVNPTWCLGVPFLGKFIAPKFGEIFSEMLPDEGPLLAFQVLRDHSELIFLVQCGVTVLVCLGVIGYCAGPWLTVAFPPVERAELLLSWRRRRWQYPVGAAAAESLPPGWFVLTARPGWLRLEWVVQDGRNAVPVVRR